jgi:hypothetical protein
VMMRRVALGVAATLRLTSAGTIGGRDDAYRRL